MIKTLAFGQFEVRFGKRETNFARVEALVADTLDVDLLVLPELGFTGYEFKDRDEVADFAEPLGGGPTSDFLRKLAHRLDAVIIAGYPERSGDRFYNSCMMATPSGELTNYRKIHLFSRECDLFLAGDAPPAVVETPAGRVGMMVCFDWIFPEVSRMLAVAGAQIIAHPSNLVLPYCQRAMFARSIENHVFTITANRIGTESRAGRSLTFTGASQIVSPDGEVLAAAASNAEAVHTVEVDVDQADAKQINPYNHLITSRRPDLYGSLVSVADKII